MSQFSDLKLLTKADAAAVFGVCTKTIDNYIRDGLLPSPVAFGSREYWHPRVFRDFLDRTFGQAIGAGGEDQKTTEELPRADPSLSSRKNSSAHNTHLSRATRKDTNPVVRQRQRQDALLRELNAEE